MDSSHDTQVMTVKDWMLTILVLAIPFVNLIMYLVWAFGTAGNLNRKNFCRASLLWFVIILGIAIILGILSAIFGAGMGGMQPSTP